MSNRLEQALANVNVSGRSARGENGENVTPQSVTVRLGRSKTTVTGKVRNVLFIESVTGALNVTSADRYGQWSPNFVGGAFGNIVGEKRFTLGKVNWKGQRSDNGAWTLTNDNGLVTICHKLQKVNYLVDLDDSPLYVGTLADATELLAIVRGEND